MNPQEQTKIILPPNIRLASLPLATLSAQQDDELPPITFTRTPAGLYCGCSFSSPEIPQSLGENPDTTCPELEALSDKPEHRLEIETPVRFSSRLTLSWQQNQAVEAALDAILSRADHSVGVCLIASHVWLGMLRRMLSVAAAGAGEGYPADTSSRERGLSPARAEAFDYYLQSTTRENFAKAFQVASKPGHHQTVRRMLLGAIMSFRRSLRPGMGRIEAMDPEGLYSVVRR
ncbi:MAG: hypothetical protein ACOC29_03175, partial [Candidatus Sumerlaeota bacterium]